MGWLGGKGAEICSPGTKVMVWSMKTIRVGYPSGKELSLPLVSCHRVPVSPPHPDLKLFAGPKFWWGGKVQPVQAYSQCSPGCFAFNLIHVGFFYGLRCDIWKTRRIEEI